MRNELGGGAATASVLVGLCGRFRATYGGSFQVAHCDVAIGSMTVGYGRESGFTLVELMVTLAVLTILLMMAAPSFMNATLGGRLSSHANSLVSSAHLARSEAIKRNAVVRLCASGNGTSCESVGWEQGWVVLSGGAVLERHGALPAGFKVISGANTIDFQPTGVGATAATLKVCRTTPSAGAQERVITIEATGRPSVAKTTTGSCP